MDNCCFLCKRECNLTSEHIIPQAIGGELVADILCKPCNDELGRTLDAEISKQFGWVGTALNINRARGKPQTYEVQEQITGKRLVSDGKNLSRRDPIVKIKSADGKKLDSADVTARSEKELKEICASIQNRYKVDVEIKTFSEEHPAPTNVVHETIIDNDLLRRAVSKIAYGFLCTKLLREKILSPSFDAIRRYIRSDTKPSLAHANYLHTGFMTDGVRPIHKIHIGFNSSEQLVVGYVSIFGIWRFTVLLAEGFTSPLHLPDLDYTFDPVRCEQVFGREMWSAPPLAREDILNPKQSKRFVEDELQAGHKIIESYNFIIKHTGGSKLS